MRRFGTDKPDLRYGMEIQDATEVTRGSEFGVFAGAECVRFLVAPKAFSRTELARLEEIAKEWGAKGLAYIVVDESGEVRSPIAKFLSETELAAFAAPPGSTVLFGAGDEAAVARVLGGLRVHLGRELGLTESAGDVFHWVLDFPLFERDDAGALDVPAPPLHRADAGSTRSGTSTIPAASARQHYDLVWNGWELGSGSIRIHDVEVQQKVFRTMGLSRRGRAVEVRLPARSAGDGCAAARRLRDGHRAASSR